MDQVSVVGRGVGTILDNVRLVLGMALGAGDANPRNNLAGRPALDALTALPFLVGLAYLFWRWKWPAASFTLAWLVAMLLPTMLQRDRALVPARHRRPAHLCAPDRYRVGPHGGVGCLAAAPMAAPGSRGPAGSCWAPA